MKKLIYVLITSVILLSNIFTVHAQNWGSWTQSNCFKGIFHRVAKDDKGYWTIQFQNTYQKNAYFQWEVYSDRACTKYISRNNRWECKGKNGIIESWLGGPYANLNTLYIKVFRLRLGNSWSEDNGDYYNSDKGCSSDN